MLGVSLLSVPMVMAAVSVPPTDGANWTLEVTAAPGGTVLGRLVRSWKSAAFVPASCWLRIES